MHFDMQQPDVTETLLKALSDMKEPIPTKPRSRLNSSLSSQGNQEQKRSRTGADIDEIGSSRSDRKNNHGGKQMPKKEGFRKKLTNWWQNGKSNVEKNDNLQKSNTKTLYKPTIMRK